MQSPSSLHRRSFLGLFCSLLVCCSCLLRADKPKEDDRPVVDDSKVKVQQAANPLLPTLFVVGDSTAKSNAPMRGWGDELAPFFDLTKINVVNRAIGGRSSRTFIVEGRWDKVLAEMKQGDFVIVQFGHNDVGPLDAKGKFRGSLRSLGEETETVVKADGSNEVVHTYGWYLRKYVNDAKAKGVSVIVASSVPHKDWANDFAEHRKLAAAVAADRGVSFIDVTIITGAAYEKLGAEKVATLFADPRTHTNSAGAQINAESVVAGIKGLDTHPLVGFLSPKGAAVTAFKACK